MPGGYEKRLHARWVAEALPGEPKHRYLRRLEAQGDEDAKKALARRRRRRVTKRPARRTA